MKYISPSEEMRSLFEEKHLLMKSGTIVDAMIITAPSSTKNEEKRRDPDMSSTKKEMSGTSV